MKKISVRSDYKIIYTMTTRWMDNDIYGHINNVVYYSYFDTAINRYLIEKAGLDIHFSPIVAYVVNSACSFHSPLEYPVDIEIGVRVKRIGTTSVEYETSIFKNGDHTASADGQIVHVFFDRSKNKSVPVPDNIKFSLEKIM